MSVLRLSVTPRYAVSQTVTAHFDFLAKTYTKRGTTSQKKSSHHRTKKINKTPTLQR